jgi:hypothetical protein
VQRLCSLVRLIVAPSDQPMVLQALPVSLGKYHPANQSAMPAIAANLLDRDAGLGLPQKANDLFFGKSALLHVRHSSG